MAHLLFLWGSSDSPRLWKLQDRKEWAVPAPPPHLLCADAVLGTVAVIYIHKQVLLFHFSGQETEVREMKQMTQRHRLARYWMAGFKPRSVRFQGLSLECAGPRGLGRIQEVALLWRGWDGELDQERLRGSAWRGSCGYQTRAETYKRAPETWPWEGRNSWRHLGSRFADCSGS